MKTIALALLVGVVSAHAALASEIFVFSDASGLAAEAEFTLLDATTLQVRLKNTSTGVPAGFSNADQLLTGVGWDFGLPGAGDTIEIIGGTVRTGSSSQSVNFNVANVGADADVSGEFGFGNAEGSGLLPNFISVNTTGATPFGGANLDGPANLNGPQAGLLATPAPLDLGGLGAIQDEIVATLTVSEALDNLTFLSLNGVGVEFGSDAAFITVPEPSALSIMCFGVGLAVLRRKRLARRVST